MPIRNAKESDFVICVEISRKAWPKFKERESIYHLFCKFFNNTCFVFEEGGDVEAFLLGFISQLDAKQGYIHLVVVDPSSQRKGIATRLYEAFFDTMREFRVWEVRLIVNPDNPGSIAFHEKLGFVPEIHGDTISVDGVLAAKDYNGPGIHMVPFVRTLS